MRQLLRNIASRWGSGNQSAEVAKERLSIILAHQRGASLLSHVDIPRLQSEVLAVVKKYIAVDTTKPINVHVKQDGTVDLFEMQVSL
ncbi:unnamed protein product [Choristocarpus tenellus]